MTTAIRRTAASIGWFPLCPCSSPADTLSWACPLHDPLLQADCEGCSEREQRRAEERMAERQARRQTQEERQMPKAGSGFWTGVAEHDGKNMPRLEIARKLRESGMSVQAIVKALGGPTSTLYDLLSDKPEKPAAQAVRDPLEARLPVQERETETPAASEPEPEPSEERSTIDAVLFPDGYEQEFRKRGLDPKLVYHIGTGIYYPGCASGPSFLDTLALDRWAQELALQECIKHREQLHLTTAKPRACSECETCDGEQPGCPFEGDETAEQTTEQTTAAIVVPHPDAKYYALLHTGGDPAQLREPVTAAS